MIRTYLLAALLLAGQVLSGCNHTKEELAVNQFSKLALQGKKVFDRHECSACHYIGNEDVESRAPDLTSPFLANDPMFVQTHLRFVELSRMPPVQLTDKEARLISYFIADLHAARQPVLNGAHADAMCPVCYASLSMKQAKANELFARFLGTTYYFECEECLNAFKKAPEAFIELLQQKDLYDIDELSLR